MSALISVVQNLTNMLPGADVTFSTSVGTFRAERMTTANVTLIRRLWDTPDGVDTLDTVYVFHRPEGALVVSAWDTSDDWATKTMNVAIHHEYVEEAETRSHEAGVSAALFVLIDRANARV